MKIKPITTVKSKGELQDLYGECLGNCKQCFYDGDCELQDKLKKED